MGGGYKIRLKLKMESNNFFQEHFSQPEELRLGLEGVRFDSLNEENNNHLIAPFIEDEIKEEVWACTTNKCLGLNRFNFCFIKHFWELLKVDIVRVVMEKFPLHGRFWKSVNASFISLIPKKKVLESLGDYKPISLIRCMYKIIVEVLSISIKKGSAQGDR